ncbi:sugar ABC transporter permease [Lipingzhangella sp. LS1_29]|uniref:Sugar ABC transporter permease n=1 Tax=Lipingzhangella rawalii TaxID=2055835 RepID=A0ABU2HAU1_9ACTN|nr:sugar ABC transporter permease [Lipingzhangella rawalii]MDS1271989.1 sugar ABC transporter permease [Lipingzhangella rawalii]
MLLAPGLIIIALLLWYPLGRVVWLSFQDYDLGNIRSGETDYIGLDNYTELLSDSFLWTTALPNTAVFAAVAVVGTVVVGTLVALLLNACGWLWRTVIITAILVAWAMPAVTGTYVWIWVFDVDQGIVRQLLDGLRTGIEAWGPQWLRDSAATSDYLAADGYNWFRERLPFYAIVTLNIVHNGFPFVAITVFAGLTTIPRELHEAAMIDGANAWQRFWDVTVPTLRPVFAVVTIMSTIWDFKVFAQVYLMPGGSGSNRDVLNFGVWSYVESFAQNQYGYGAAIAVVLTVLLLLITLVYLRTLFAEEKL